MRVVVTGSSGRIGRAIHDRLATAHVVVGVDRVAAPSTAVIGDVTDPTRLRQLLGGADAVVHVAALHAPQVGRVSDAEFERVNVDGTAAVIDAALACGVRRLVLTSTTALYGGGSPSGPARWIDEETEPRPRTVYHTTKLRAEALARAASGDGLVVRVIRMSRCFPEPTPLMAMYRLHRGVDARDVADAHVLALGDGAHAHDCYVVSGVSPFLRDDCEALGVDAPAVLRRRAPEVVDAFGRRGWAMPRRIDRVYVSGRAHERLDWRPRYGALDVIAACDARGRYMPAAIRGGA